jgi:hypothetical protein
MTEPEAVSFHRRVSDQVARTLGSQLDPTVDIARLTDSLRLLAKWRSVLLQDAWLQREGNRVNCGPFAGMQLSQRSGEGCHVAKLIGIYEQPLWPVLEKVIGETYDLVLNVGAAEGYYAIGMARRMPGVPVIAHESNAAAREILTRLIELNEVTERVTPRGLLEPTDLSGFEDRRILLICDIEGGEIDLLSGTVPKSLRYSDLIVETHDTQHRPGIAVELARRFEASHEVTSIADSGMRNFDPPDWFMRLPHLDQLLCTWEWRSTPTPWLFMTARNRQPG